MMFKKSEKDIRNERIQRALPEEKYRKPSPIGDTKWDEENFLDFTVIQRGQSIKLHTYRCHTDLNEIKSVTVFFHGLNEHMGQYSHIAQAISKQANSVAVGLDFRGFGKSEGIRGWIESSNQLIEDCSKFIQQIKNLYPNLPLFTIGQSLGGLACYLMGMNNLTDGSILLVPAIMDNYYNRPYLKYVALMFGALIPRLSLFEAEDIHGSKNPQILEDFQRDPYCVKIATLPGTAKVLLSQMRSLPLTFRNYKTPFLIISGGMDQIIDPDVGFELMKQSPSLDKQHLHYENMWHECIQEEEINEIIPEIVQWIKERSRK